MRFCVVTMLALSAVMTTPIFAEEAPAAVEAAKEIPELEAEIAYVEALVNNGYPDLADPIIEVTKKKWPESEARFFAIEVRGMLALGKFAEAEKKIAALPDRKSSKYWAARLEIANNYFGRGQKKECMKIYDEFFKVFAKPPADIRKFYTNACYAYGQLLIGDKQYAKAVQRYAALLGQLNQGDDHWCNIACETVDLYLRLAEGVKNDVKQIKTRDGYLDSAEKIVNTLLWQLEKPVYFGRALSMKAHIWQIRGDVQKAAQIIDEYKPQLQELHDNIVQFDPDGSQGLIRQSPLPECMYLQAKMLFDAAKEEYKSAKRDDEKVKSLMFGPKEGGKRKVSKGCFAMAQNIFLNYETSTWAPAAGEMAEAIRKFAVEKYNAKIKTNITKDQIAKVRAAQFKIADEKFNAGYALEAIDAYLDVLAKYPELPESIRAVENVASAYIDLAHDAKDKSKKEEYRLYAEAVEGYLSERFAGSTDKLVMMSAGDSTIRIAAKESQYRNMVAADRMYVSFFNNYHEHTSAATLAAAKAMEFQKAKKFENAIKYWQIIENNYSNAMVFATALMQASVCYGELDKQDEQIDYLTKYLSAETVNVRKLQAQFQLAQIYQKDGLAQLAIAATNAIPEEVEKAEAQGSKQIIYAIKTFGSFSSEVDKAIAAPTTTKEDVEKYKVLREAAMFMVGECWSRMHRPVDKLASFRAKAAESFEVYLKEYPTGKYAKVGYVKLGTIYTALGDMNKSKDALDRLSNKFPDSDEAKNAKPRLAKNLIEMGMLHEGAEIYAEMLRTDGAYTPIQFVLAGEALVDAKSFEVANQAFGKVIRMTGTNVTASVIARARLGIAKSAWKQGLFAEARDALDQFLGDANMAKLALAADANFMLVEVSSEQGRVEKDNEMRRKYFNTAIGALKKVRQYWKAKPQFEQDVLDLMSGDVLVDRMHAEETMGLKDEARETCAKAAAVFQVFLQAHGVTPEHPLDKMDEGSVANLERAYATMIPLFSKLGAEQADRVMKFGEEYLEYFPDGKHLTEIQNCMNQAKADLPAAK